jgi:SAM-dependent methyltransferase
MSDITNSVDGFYTKPVSSYIENYRADHGPRIGELVRRYGLKEKLAGKRLADVGGGLGFAGEYLDKSTEYHVFDGANIPEESKVSKGIWHKVDLDYHRFGDYWNNYGTLPKQPDILGALPSKPFDAAFCLEVLEHLSNPYNAIVEIKKMVKENGNIFISIPTELVTHNVVYPSLLWPHANFEIFLRQMALPIIDFYTYEPKDRGWPAYQYKCLNRPWKEKKLVFPKFESKFLDCTPVEATNL